MDFQPLFFAESLPSTPGYSQIFDCHYPIQPQTPPDSHSGSPNVGFDGITWPETPPFYPCSYTPKDHPQTTLPSLEEFDQGVQALAQVHGTINPEVPFSSDLSIEHRSFLHPPGPVSFIGPSWSDRDHPFDEPAKDHHGIQAGTTTNPARSAWVPNQAALPMQENCYSYQSSDLPLGACNGIKGYPSPPPECEPRHINQKYTTEEGDYVIYAWHDKKMKWQQIKQEFASLFGRTPERTVQGLQAWYYRMNQRIPIWDQDGWLCFANWDDLEPLHVSIKCRDRDSQDRPLEPLGLAQRYPERAVNYSWVDPELKLQARDWAAKRAFQLSERHRRRRCQELSLIKF